MSNGATGWPWTPATLAQGFLSNRWLRRDGDVYGGASLRGVRGPNSPIAGGESVNAEVDVSSGAARVVDAPIINPKRNLRPSVGGRN